VKKVEIENATPYRIEALPMMGPEEKPIVTVVVKGTFQILENQTVSTADDQMPVVYGDELYDPDNGGSVKFESDLVPFKPKADIVLTGRAHAPRNIPVPSLPVTLRVGHMKKSLKIFGDRQWKCRSRWLPCFVSSPEPFTSMDLVYERAFGGLDTVGGGYCEKNLVGCGFVGKKTKKALNGVKLANIEDPDQLIRSWKDRPSPAGFGFYGKSWAPRMQFMGTYDDNWRKNRSPRPPVDFRADYFNAAHPDLQLRDYLVGNEEVELVNLSVEGYLRFRLPGITIRCEATKSFDLVVFPEPAVPDLGDLPKRPLFQEMIPMNCDTLCLIPDEKRFYMVWRGVCPVSDLTGLEVKKIAVTEVPFHL
jgi:hypothetical protein